MNEREARDDDIDGYRNENIYEAVNDEELEMTTCVAYGTI